MGLRFDHAVIVVKDLQQAMGDYRELGFTVLPGGEHVSFPTHNALIGLADGAYIELIAFRHRVAPTDLRPTDTEGWHRFANTAEDPIGRLIAQWDAAGPGLVHFALCPEAIDDDLARARAGGLDMDGPIPGSRQRPDGQRVAWQMGVPLGMDVPFLCGDVTDRALRVPGGQDAVHENGALGVHRMIVALRDLEGASRRYAALLGSEPEPSTVDGLPDAEALDFLLGSARITIAAPVGDMGPIQAHLKADGEGPVGLWLTGGETMGRRALSPSLTRGARISIVPGE